MAKQWYGAAGQGGAAGAAAVAPDKTVLLSTRNIEGAAALPATHINTEALLKHHGVLMTVDAVRRVEALWGGDRVKGRRVPVAQTEEAD